MIHGYPLQYSWASLVAQLLKNPPTALETWIQFQGWEDPLQKGKAFPSSIPRGTLIYLHFYSFHSVMLQGGALLDS